MTSRGARITTIVPIILVGLLLYDAATKPGWDLAREIGFVLGVVFLSLLAIARYQLGDAFSIAPEARVLEARFGDDYRAYRAKTWF